MKINDILGIMDTIEYGFKDNNGFNIINDTEKWDNEFNKFYYLLTPEELLETKCGVCWDQVELERKLFESANYEVKTYFIYCIQNGDLPSHTFLVYKDNDKYYWFEHSWNTYKGIHEYDSELSLLLDIKDKFLNSQKYENEFCFVYEYSRPQSHITCNEFYEYIDSQKLIKLNEPLYFYHLVNKDADMSHGLISLQYMYDNNLNELFDKYVSKYKNRIINDWNLKKYKDKDNLSREDYIEALNTFRGIDGSNYLYFFKYPPYMDLGEKIKELSKYKDIYRININDEEVQKIIKDIFYGYDLSNSDNKELNKKYYEKVSKEEYFSKYDDKTEMNFSRLNHIGISFIDGVCPLEYLEKVDWE